MPDEVASPLDHLFFRYILIFSYDMLATTSIRRTAVVGLKEEEEKN